MIKQLLSLLLGTALLAQTAAAGVSFRATNNLGGPVTLALYTNAGGFYTLAVQQTLATNTAATLTNPATYWQGVLVLNTNSSMALLAPFTVLTNAAANVSLVISLGSHAHILTGGAPRTGTNVAGGGALSSAVSTNIAGGGSLSSSASTNIAGVTVAAVTNQLYVSGASVTGANGYYTNFLPPLAGPVTNLASGFLLTETLTTNSISGISNFHQQQATFTVSYTGTNYYTNIVTVTKMDSYVSSHGWPVQSPAGAGWQAVNTNNLPPLSQYPAPSLPSRRAGFYNYSSSPSTNLAH